MPNCEICMNVPGFSLSSLHLIPNDFFFLNINQPLSTLSQVFTEITLIHWNFIGLGNIWLNYIITSKAGIQQLVGKEDQTKDQTTSHWLLNMTWPSTSSLTGGTMSQSFYYTLSCLLKHCTQKTLQACNHLHDSKYFNVTNFFNCQNFPF